MLWLRTTPTTTQGHRISIHLGKLRCVARNVPTHPYMSGVHVMRIVRQHRARAMPRRPALEPWQTHGHNPHALASAVWPNGVVGMELLSVWGLVSKGEGEDATPTTRRALQSDVDKPGGEVHLRPTLTSGNGPGMVQTFHSCRDVGSGLDDLLLYAGRGDALLRWYSHTLGQHWRRTHVCGWGRSLGPVCTDMRATQVHQCVGVNSSWLCTHARTRTTVALCEQGLMRIQLLPR